MKTEELRKQLLAALREEADEMDLANPAAKATETLESFVLTESLEENYVEAVAERIRELRVADPDASEADLVVRAIAEACMEFRRGIQESTAGEKPMRRTGQ
jgi:hypothetical protein